MTLEQIYARIPKVACQQKCQECCGPISMSHLEFEKIFSRAPLPSEFFVSAPTVVDPITGNCPKLGRDGSCKVYEQRPAICRLWGVVREMACPFGCTPKRWLSNREAHQILGLVEEVSARSERLVNR